MSCFTASSTMRGIVLMLLFCFGCAGKTLVPLLASGAPVTPTPSSEVPLEVVTHSGAVGNPLAVRGASVAYSDLRARSASRSPPRP